MKSHRSCKTLVSGAEAYTRCVAILSFSSRRGGSLRSTGGEIGPSLARLSRFGCSAEDTVETGRRQCAREDLGELEASSPALKHHHDAMCELPAQCQLAGVMAKWASAGSLGLHAGGIYSLPRIWDSPSVTCWRSK